MVCITWRINGSRNVKLFNFLIPFQYGFLLFVIFVCGLAASIVYGVFNAKVGTFRTAGYKYKCFKFPCTVTPLFVYFRTIRSEIHRILSTMENLQSILSLVNECFFVAHLLFTFLFEFISYAFHFYHLMVMYYFSYLLLFESGFIRSCWNHWIFISDLNLGIPYIYPSGCNVWNNKHRTNEWMPKCVICISVASFKPLYDLTLCFSDQNF